MSENTKIEWCDSTFNPWTGCTKVSPGCDNCYAEGWAKRSGTVQWGPHAERRRTSVGNWKLPLRWEREHEAFFAQHGRRRRVFCASLADVFDNAVPTAWRIDLFNLIASTPHLDWLLVTKRIGNVLDMLDVALGFGSVKPVAPWPWPNVWLGISVTSQAEADRDIPKLLQVPAAVRFLSCEPLLGPLDLEHEYLADRCGGRYPFPSLPREHRTTWLHLLDWVIVGGESGPKARPMHPQWARSLRDQCAAAGVPFLFKQWGEYGPTADGFARNGDVLHNDGQWSARIGKKAAGRLLDGREHNEFPITSTTGG
jgi:protein gp37